MSGPSAKDNESAERYFESERTMFGGVAKHAWLIGTTIGQRKSDPLRVTASWLFIRACVTAQSIQRLFEPTAAISGAIKYLDHGSICVLSRSLIENIAVLLYIGDTEVDEEEWKLRNYIIDIHDLENRVEFLKFLRHESKESPVPSREFLKGLILENKVFQALPPRRQKRLVDGDDMFLHGRHAALLKLGWDDDLTRGIYKYLSNQAHSLPMAFQRTEMNALYEKDSPGAKGTAAFATEFARRALGAGCFRMITLFPDVELAFDPAIVIGLRKAYGPSTT